MIQSKPIKILAIEDDEFMRIFLKDVFWIHGGTQAEVNITSNLEKAKEFFKDEKAIPDLIFLDLNLPEKDGASPKMENSFNFLEELKSNPRTKNIKVIILSGFDDKEIKERALKLGADRFLSKGGYLPQEITQITEEVMASN